VVTLEHDNGSTSKFNSQENSIQRGWWTHLAFSYDAALSEGKLFVNGEDQTLVVADPNGNIADNSSDDLIIGNNINFSKSFIGVIDELRFWNRVLDETEVQDYMTDYLVGDEDSLVVYWQMNEGNGDSIIDITENANNAFVDQARWTEGTPFEPTAIPENKIIASQLNELSVSPNPFSDYTRFEYQLSEKTNVELNIYSLSGKLVSTLVNETQAAGIKSVSWDGSDLKGNLLQEGMFLGTLKTGNKIVYQKIILVK